jgi:integrase
MIYKRQNTYWYKFQWQGRLVRESSKQGNQKVARQMEAAHRTSLAKGEVGIRDKRPAPPLAEFLKDDFLPFVEAHFADKEKTIGTYGYGAKCLLASDLAKLRLDEITSQHAAAYAASHAQHSASTVNVALSTLRRALNLAEEWGKLTRAAHIPLAQGARQRERVVGDSEFAAYIKCCPQPWHDVAMLIRAEAMRPGECYKLRWEHVVLNGEGGLIQIVEGKSKNARRLLPMLPEVRELLKARHIEQGRPESGWVFPTGSLCGHIEQSTAKTQHAKALELSVVEPFEPYCLRHTALTRLGESGCDAFTLARIAGHASIMMTQRYVHPQAEAIERAFAAVENRALPVAVTGQ